LLERSGGIHRHNRTRVGRWFPQLSNLVTHQLSIGVDLEAQTDSEGERLWRRGFVGALFGSPSFALGAKGEGFCQKTGGRHSHGAGVAASRVVSELTVSDSKWENVLRDRWSRAHRGPDAQANGSKSARIAGGICQVSAKKKGWG
jgi:hypothetical protein